MRVYISADMEGITGLVSWAQCGQPKGDFYDFAFARRMMSHDVNAAVRGARAAGATEVVVKDSHGVMKNMLIDGLEEGIQLIQGTGFGATDGMMQGVGDGKFDAAILVGYHAMAGTARGIMEHTWTGGIHRVWINGREVGEMGLSMGVAAQYGVPIVAVTSDVAGTKEAKAFIPGIHVAATKEGFGRYSGRLLHPSETAPLIETAVKAGVTDRAKIKPIVYSTPVTMAIEFNRSEQADLCDNVSVVDRKDGYTLEGKFKSFADAHAAFVLLAGLSNYAVSSQA
jgi:D-amino peptidase